MSKGLYANIHAKRKRIKQGSNEKMRKVGTKGAPTASSFKKAAGSKSGSSGTVTMLINSLNFLVGHTISSKDILHLGGREGDFIILPAGVTITGTSTQNMTMIVSIVEFNDVIQGG